MGCTSRGRYQKALMVRMIVTRLTLNLPARACRPSGISAAVIGPVSQSAAGVRRALPHFTQKW